MIAQQLLELRQQKRSKAAKDDTVVALTAAPSNIEHSNKFVGHIHEGYSTARPNLALIVRKKERSVPTRYGRGCIQGDPCR